jgi:hypothetical protein
MRTEAAEQWRPISGFPSYAVSDQGRIKRLTSRTCGKAGHVLKPNARKRPNGARAYLMVSLCADGRVTSRAVHRLVAEAFVPAVDGKPEVNHKNGDRFDNRASNLEWTTSSENQLHAYAIDLQSAQGEKNGQAKLQAVDVFEIVARYDALVPTPRIAEDFGVSETTVRDIAAGRSWAHITGRKPNDPRPRRYVRREKAHAA